MIVDLDDALAHPVAIEEVSQLGLAGHDVVLAAPFSPDRPLKIYEPNFSELQSTFGGDVWIHLRAFRKRLFDSLEDSHFKKDDLWLDDQVDYAMMLPIVKLAEKPVYLPQYRYWHERTTVLDQQGERQRDQTIMHLLDKLRSLENTKRSNTQRTD